MGFSILPIVLGEFYWPVYYSQVVLSHYLITIVRKTILVNQILTHRELIFRDNSQFYILSKKSLDNIPLLNQFQKAILVSEILRFKCLIELTAVVIRTTRFTNQSVSEHPLGVIALE